MPNFQLRSGLTDFMVVARGYNYRNNDEKREEEALFAMIPAVQKRGYLLREELLAVAQWKSPRRAKNVNNNSEKYIEEITRLALHAKDERARIEPLTTLHGLGWPTASVILHFFHEDPYPILDFRALWSLSEEEPKKGYDFPFWWTYVTYWRSLLVKHKLDKRTLDRALWAYSKEPPPEEKT